MFQTQRDCYQHNQQRVKFPARAAQIHISFNFVSAARQMETIFPQQPR